MDGLGIATAVLVVSLLLASQSDTPPSGLADENEDQTGWSAFVLKDVRTEKAFKIDDFKGKPVLVESFAVWCPTCTKQQEEIKKLHSEVGDSVISVSLDTDPNEDETKVMEHIQRNDFDWYYSVAPAEMTKMLIDEFGVSIVNAPSAPVILVCSDGSARKLGSGVKKADELKSLVEEC